LRRIHRCHLFAQRSRLRLAASIFLCLALAASGCFSGDEESPYYGRVDQARAGELRWSDGGLPKIFDPARVAAPPDTDAVRALFEGLTEYNPRTLAPEPGVAVRWESSPDGREWTFYLRREARWSNGDQVTAQDFVRSWRRALKLGERAPHAELMRNISGAPPQMNEPVARAGTEGSNRAESQAARILPGQSSQKTAAGPEPRSKAPAVEAAPLGVEALNDHTLRVRLQRPDKNFPALVAHPIFRPVHQSGTSPEARREPPSAAEAEGASQALPVVSNGAFQLSGVAPDGVVLERASNYWDAKAVALERVRFVAAPDAEAALAAYRAGEVDVVTNAAFEPLALKLLATYKDFRRATFGAITYYEFNMARYPFTDQRVREALAIAIDRRRLSEETMDGATEPAERFLPVPSSGPADPAEVPPSPLQYDPSRARLLLAEAGYPGGAGFPRIRLLINRNDQHRILAQAIAGMWRTALGIETEVIIKNWDEYEAAYKAGDYDIARRSMVMQTLDETTNMLAMFDRRQPAIPLVDPFNASLAGAQPSLAEGGEPGSAPGAEVARMPVLTEAEALREVPAIPLHFAVSHALVKPYVTGFDTNLLDSPSLKSARIDSAWRPPKQANVLLF
jgi:ABC-type oligopeptide transport system substrate-binding subunit